MKLPSTADEVIELLDRSFPLRTFPVDMPVHHIQRELGKRDVIEYLRRLQAERDEDIGAKLLAKALLDNE